MMVAAPSSARIAERIGTKFTVAIGLTLVTTGLVLMTGLGTDTGYGAIAARLVLIAMGMGLTMAPATESVMGSLPLAKAGVGSAVNDTTRQVGGALGVAIIGSVLSSSYGSTVEDFLATTPAPADAATAASGSIGGAIAVAGQLAESGAAGGAQAASQLVTVANDAFVEGLHRGSLVAALATGIGVVVALVFLPARARSIDESEQQAEYAAEHAHDEGAPVAGSAAAAGPIEP
jgi:hypothetical protein